MAKEKITRADLFYNYVMQGLIDNNLTFAEVCGVFEIVKFEFAGALTKNEADKK